MLLSGEKFHLRLAVLIITALNPIHPGHRTQTRASKRLKTQKFTADRIAFRADAQTAGRPIRLKPDRFYEIAIAVR